MLILFYCRLSLGKNHKNATIAIAAAIIKIGLRANPLKISSPVEANTMMMSVMAKIIFCAGKSLTSFNYDNLIIHKKGRVCLMRHKIQPSDYTMQVVCIRHIILKNY